MTTILPPYVKNFDSFLFWARGAVYAQGVKVSEDNLVATARRRWEDILEELDVTPCPPAAEWCDQNGNHGWKRPYFHGAGFDRSHRYHQHAVSENVLVLMSEYDPSCLKDDPDLVSTTDVWTNEVFFRSAAEVEAHVAALREAARIAFAGGITIDETPAGTTP